MSTKEKESKNVKNKNLTKSDKTRQLSDKQLRAIPLILSGKRDSEVAEAVSVTRQTVNKWKNHNAYFQAELNNQRYEIYESQNERIRTLRSRAIDEIEAEFDSDDEKIRKDASRFILGKQDFKPSGKTSAREILEDTAFSLMLNDWKKDI